MCPAYDSELTFLAGVDKELTVAPTSFQTWNGNDPATYASSSDAIKWGDPTPGTPGGTVTYWFSAESAWSISEIGAWLGGFALWSAVANVTFSLAADAASANVAIDRDTDGQTYVSFGPQAGTPVGSSTVATPPATGSFISFDTSLPGYGPLVNDFTSQGGSPYWRMLQEVGQILGLGNAGPYQAQDNAEAQQFGPHDTMLWSVMSDVTPWNTTATFFKDYPVTDTYWAGASASDPSPLPLTPMMLDIMAIQRLYGEATGGPLTTGQTFGFNQTIGGAIGQFYDFSINSSPVVTLWSSATGNTLDVSGFAQDASVSLIPGTFSSVGGSINNVGIAFDTVIENATGGSGNDLIVASNASSVLKGGLGNDILVGGSGADDLQGGPGDDYLNGGAGVDTLSGGSGNNFFGFARGEAGGDTVVDFASGDGLQFFGYGYASQGATFTQINPNQWSINSADGTVHDVVNFTTVPVIDPSDVSFLPEYKTLEHSGYLDFLGYRQTSETSVEQAYHIGTNYSVATTAGFNVAIILERNQDPTALLQQDWGTRQQTLEQLQKAGTLWTTYGADQAKFDEVRDTLKNEYGLTILDATKDKADGSPNGSYVTSAESRTIWVSIDTAEQFSELFQTTLYSANDRDDMTFWLGNLSVPKDWGVAGLWIDQDWKTPEATALAGGDMPLDPGPQGTGNASPVQPAIAPNLIADLYNFPLNSLDVGSGGFKTGKIGLVEPGIGSAVSDAVPVPDDPSTFPDVVFQGLLTQYLNQGINVYGDGKVHTQGVDGQSWADQSSSASERSLDVGVVAAINPNSDIILYNGSGNNGNADCTIYTALQSAIFDKDHDPEVVSSSFNDSEYMDPRSPFYRAYWELYVDSALSSKTIFNALGDKGSGYAIANGLSNLDYNVAFPYTVLVGGTSISSSTASQSDPTLLDNYWLPALGDTAAIIWRLVAGGLTTLPTSAADIPFFIETVWNQYYLNGTDIEYYNNGSLSSGGYQSNVTTSGGVDPSQPTPWYQTAYGLAPVTADPWAQTGRGAPDVAADASGNLNYLVPPDDMAGIHSDGGTSAASPLWAALAVQINTIFHDQGLPQLGYMNDLLYIASAIAPASFNDVSLGGNVSSYVNGTAGPYIYNSGGEITPTGYGYEAGYGYDYVSGLGSPNGVVLARTLTAVAHAEISSTAPAVMNVVDAFTGTSTVAQTLLVQNNFITGSDVLVQVDGTDAVEMGMNSALGWTSRLAGQAVQGDNFDSALVTLLDGAAKAVPYEISVQAGDMLGVSADGTGLGLYQQLLTNDFGFIQFGNASGGITLARPVAIAQTADGAPDQDAILRIRQNGGDATKIEIYKVDDLNGTVNGLAPGQAGYEVQALARDYYTKDGHTDINGPGQGNFRQVEITGVNPGDIMAMKYTDVTTHDVYWAFSQGNTGNVTAIFNYGLNTWGFEDRPVTGDHDFQDLVVQIDFTSTAGHGLLVA